MKTREWGSGQPVIAMHPLGLESSAFEAVGRALAPLGFRTIAVDLPGFGETPLPEGRLTPAALAAPVVELAQSLDQAPVVMGVSMGGRVALEVALLAPERVRAVVAIAPFLPWLRFRPLLDLAWLFDPHLAAAIPFELAWPLLQRLSRALELVPWLRDDAMAQAAMRFVYFLACPATRAGFLGAAREMALDPPSGSNGLWTRMRTLALPTAFVWGERDQIVSLRFSRTVARECPQAEQLLLPCVGHWLNGPHHRCLSATLAELLPHLLTGRRVASAVMHASGVEFFVAPCTAIGTAQSAVTVVTELGGGIDGA